MPFPALQAVPTTPHIEKVVAEGQAGCYVHPENLALDVCASCGRFICEVCQIELGNRRLCASCLMRDQQSKSIPELDSRRILYDEIAFSIALLSILLYCFTIFTAPVVIFMVIRYWNHPGGAKGNSRIKLSIAFAIALLQLSVWLFWIVGGL